MTSTCWIQLSLPLYHMPQISRLSAARRYSVAFAGCWCLDRSVWTGQFGRVRNLKVRYVLASVPLCLCICGYNAACAAKQTPHCECISK
jgi:hypothetical protein